MEDIPKHQLMDKENVVCTRPYTWFMAEYYYSAIKKEEENPAICKNIGQTLRVLY